jgi:cell division protein ZapA
MAQVTVVVNGRSFKWGCQEGAQGRVQAIAGEIDAIVQRIRSSTRTVQDDRLFLMAAMIVADQLWDAREDVQHLQRLTGGDLRYPTMNAGVHGMQRELNRAMEASGKADAGHRATGNA